MMQHDPFIHLKKAIQQGKCSKKPKISLGKSRKEYFEINGLMQLVDGLIETTSQCNFFLFFDIEVINEKRDKGESYANKDISLTDLENALINSLEYLDRVSEFYKKLVIKDYPFQVRLPLTRVGFNFERLKIVFNKFLECHPNLKSFSDKILLEDHSDEIKYYKDELDSLLPNNIKEQKHSFQEFLDLTAEIAAKTVTNSKKNSKLKSDLKSIIDSSKLYITTEIPVTQYFTKKEKNPWVYPYGCGGKTSGRVKELTEMLYGKEAPQTFNIDIKLPNIHVRKPKPLAPNTLITKINEEISGNTTPKDSSILAINNSSPNTSDNEDNEMKKKEPNTSPVIPKNMLFLSQTRTSNPNSPTTSPGSTSPKRSPSPDFKSEHEADSRNALAFLFENVKLKNASQLMLENFDTYVKYLIAEDKKRLSQEIQAETSTSSSTPKPSQP